MCTSASQKDVTKKSVVMFLGFLQIKMVNVVFVAS